MKNSHEVKTALEMGEVLPRVKYVVPALEGLGKWHFATGFTLKTGSLMPGQDGNLWGPRPWSLGEDDKR